MFTNIPGGYVTPNGNVVMSNGTGGTITPNGNVIINNPQPIIQNPQPITQIKKWFFIKNKE